MLLEEMWVKASSKIMSGVGKFRSYEKWNVRSVPVTSYKENGKKCVWTLDCGGHCTELEAISATNTLQDTAALSSGSVLGGVVSCSIN